MIGALGEVAAAAGGRLVNADPAAPIAGVTTDTRALADGDLFVALAGPNFDGHDFVGAALLRGACAALVEREGVLGGRAGVVVPDTYAALLALAGWHRRKFAAKAVAITGSSGKTTTKALVAAVLAHVGGPDAACVAEASFNNAVGVSKTLFRLSSSHRWLVCELGMNAPGEIGPLSRAVAPSVAVVTNVGRAHVGMLGSAREVRRAKAEILQGLAEGGTLCVNADDAGAVWVGRRWGGRVMTFGTRSGCDVRALRVFEGPTGVRFTWDGERVSLRMLGRHNVHNALAAAAVCTALGIEQREIALGLAEAEPPPMRMERREVSGFDLILDCYNANPESTVAALRTLATLPTRGRRVAVLGEMLELGGEAEAAWSDVADCLAGGPAGGAAGRAAGAGGGAVDLVVAVGGARALAEELKSRSIPDVVVMCVEDVDMVGKNVLPLLRPGDTILIKASRRVGLERVADIFAKDSGNPANRRSGE